MISALLLIHLGAILAGPCSVPPASELSQIVWRCYRPYLDAAYLNHGYHFFAPEPGPSHLIRYEVETRDGRRVAGFFPDRQRHWPRLLYHRHFMLSEHLNSMHESEEPAAQLTAIQNSFTQHLQSLHGGDRVKLYLVRHLIPGPDSVAKGQRLNDRTLYQERWLGDYPAIPGTSPTQIARQPQETVPERKDL